MLTGVTGALSTGRVSANMPWKPPRHSLVRKIFTGDEKLARWSVWAAMLAESTAPSGKRKAPGHSGKCRVLSLQPGGLGEGGRKEPLRKRSPKVRHFLMEMEE